MYKITKMKIVLTLILFVIIGKISCSDNAHVLQRLKDLNQQYEVDETELKHNKLQLQHIRTQKEQIRENVKQIRRRATSNVMFHARLSGTYSQMSPKQLITFDNVLTNLGNGYDSQFGVFTAPVAGIYEFIATVWANSAYFVNVEMNKNTETICKAHAARYESMGLCSAMVHLNVGDDVFVRHHNGEGRYLLGNFYPSFSGHLIHAD